MTLGTRTRARRRLQLVDEKKNYTDLKKLLKTGAFAEITELTE